MSSEPPIYRKGADMFMPPPSVNDMPTEPPSMPTNLVAQKEHRPHAEAIKFLRWWARDMRAAGQGERAALMDAAADALDRGRSPEERHDER